MFYNRGNILYWKNLDPFLLKALRKFAAENGFVVYPAPF